MTYQEKLQDPRWKEKRLEILNRDNFTCQMCGSENKQLQVHHKYYKKSEPWDYYNDALITLCCDCHSLETDLYTKEIKFKDLLDNNICIYTMNNTINIISDSSILNISIEKWRQINLKIESRFKK